MKKAISRRCAKNTARRRLSRARFSAAVWRACSVDRGSFFISGGECLRRMAAPIKIIVCDEVPEFAAELVPDIVSRRVDAHERGMVIVGATRMGKTAALKILMAKPVKEESA